MLRCPEIRNSCLTVPCNGFPMMRLLTKHYVSAAERAGAISADMEHSAAREHDDCGPADIDVHRQLAGAVAAERDMLHRLECEIRRSG